MIIPLAGIVLGEPDDAFVEGARNAGRADWIADLADGRGSFANVSRSEVREYDSWTDTLAWAASVSTGSLPGIVYDKVNQ